MNQIPRFMCDEMLGHLCRYLRAAGYDTRLAREGADDAELLQQCQREQRQFLTQDRRIHEHKAARGVAFVLPTDDLNRLAVLVARRYQLDWLNHCFTRCLLDNTSLVAADAAALARVPHDVLEIGGSLSQCPTCGRVYWQGSHYERMHARLAAWQAESKNCSSIYTHIAS